MLLNNSENNPQHLVTFYKIKNGLLDLVSQVACIEEDASCDTQKTKAVNADSEIQA